MQTNNVNLYCETPKVRKEKPIFSEKKLAFYGVLIALVIIFGKLSFQHGETIRNMLVERTLVTYEKVLTDGDIAFTYAWKDSYKYKHVWIPVLIGVAITYFTWCMVYLDSSIPGVQPPSPLSPLTASKRRLSRSSRGIHLDLNYIFAIFIGVFTGFYLYYKEYFKD